MTGEEKRFTDALYASPEDDALRLVYADWLEERSDPRGEYLRAEVEHFRRHRKVRGSVVWSLQKKVGPVWAATVSRAPFGILVPGLTFRDTGPKIGPSQIKRLEKAWGEQLPPDYTAFLLRYNGGRPSKPYLYSYGDYPDGAEHYYDEVRFFSTAEGHPSRRPYLRMNVTEAFQGHVAEDQDEDRLARMMPIGALDRGDGSEGLLALLLGDDEEFYHVVELEYWEHNGLSEADAAVHAQESFVELLMSLCERSDG